MTGIVWHKPLRGRMIGIWGDHPSMENFLVGITQIKFSQIEKKLPAPQATQEGSPPGRIPRWEGFVPDECWDQVATLAKELGFDLEDPDSTGFLSFNRPPWESKP